MANNPLRLLTVVIMAIAVLSVPAKAVEPDEILDDPALEAQAREISRQLRCVVCQSQSIDDSDAPLAKDMRIIVRERLVAGDSEEDVLAFMVARYGDYVLLKPPVQTNTLLLWAAPMLIFVFAGGAAIFYFINLGKSSPPDDTASPSS